MPYTRTPHQAYMMQIVQQKCVCDLSAGNSGDTPPARYTVSGMKRGSREHKSMQERAPRRRAARRDR